MTARSSAFDVQRSARLDTLFQRVARLCSIAVMLIGCLGLLGWIFDIAIFKQILPGLATMKVNTALCFSLAGAALAGLHAGHDRQPIRWAGRISAGAVVVIAVLTLSEYFVGWDLRIDQLLFADPASVVFPGRMSIVAALNFSLLGLALLLLDAQRAYWLASILTSMALLIAWIAMIGYIYGVTSLYQIFPFSTIAVHTVAALIVLSIGALFAQPNYGLAALIANGSAAGLMARRLLPVAVFIPLLLGWLRWQGQLAGLYDTQFGLVIMVVATTILFTAFVWWNARSLALIDRERLRIAEALLISEERFRAIFEQAAVGIARVGPQGQWLQVNQKLCDIVGYTRAELLDSSFQAITYPDDLDADLAYVGQMLAGEIQTYSMEKRSIRKDDTLIWINLTVSLVRESSGEPQYFIAVIQDISDRKQAETALRQSEMRFAKIFRTSPAALAIADIATGRFVDVNESYAQLVGYRAEEMCGRSANDLGVHVDAEQRAAIVGLVREQGYVHGYEASIRTKSGEVRDVLYSLDVIDLDDKPRMLGFLVDITERKRVELALRESEERLHAVTDTARVGLVIVDREHRYRYANRAYAKIFHLPTYAILGQRVADVLARVYEDQIRPRLERAFQGQTVSYELVVPPAAPSGEEQWYAVTYEPGEYRSETVVVVVVLEITERKRAEQALATERYWLRTLIDNLPDLIFLKDTHSRFMIGNRAIAQFIDVSTPEALLGKTDFDFFPPEAAAHYYAQEQQVIQSGEPLIIQEKRQTDVVGNFHWLSTTKMALRDAQGQVVGLVGIERVITERKQAEAALRQSEERFATAFRASPAAMVIARLADGSIIDTNDSYQRLLGYSREELVRHNGIELNIFVDPRDRAEMVRIVRERGAVRDYEVTVRAKSGELHDVLAAIEVIELDGEACNLVIMFDITERKRAEQAIQRYTERLKHLREIDQAMLANRSLEEIAQAALSHIRQMIPCTRISLVLVDMAAQTITLFAVQVNADLRMPPGLQAPIEIIGAAFEPLKQGQVYQVPDIVALPEPPPALRAAQVEHVRAYAYVPIISDTELIGLLCLGSDQPGAFLDESIDIATELAGQLAIAIDQARLRAEIEQYAAELEQRVAVRTAELAAANKELEAFSYSVSHDLRAPLRAIAGFSRILIEEYLPELPTEAHEYLLLVRDNAQQMDLLINDLLDFARLGRQLLNKQPIAPADLVRQIIAELSGEQAEQDVEFVVADLPICAADPALLRQVYINLLANALKFTSKRAAARIEVGALTMPDLPGEIVYFVKDNGAGFDMRYAGKLFGVFQRLHRAEDYAGTGVGLAIVQRVVHRHGGRVWAEAAVDQGATFYFTLGGSATHV